MVAKCWKWIKPIQVPRHTNTRMSFIFAKRGMAPNTPHAPFPSLSFRYETAVTFACYLLVGVQSGLILSSANDPLKAAHHKRARHARSWRGASGTDDVSLEVEGCKFFATAGAPMMCNLLCSAMGWHVHWPFSRRRSGAYWQWEVALTWKMKPDLDQTILPVPVEIVHCLLH